LDFNLLEPRQFHYFVDEMNMGFSTFARSFSEAFRPALSHASMPPLQERQFYGFLNLPQLDAPINLAISPRL
jgi:hypothetical protein